MLKQSLEQKLQQKLSPAQIQVIKMLEVPTLELEERIRQELEENPALEEGRESNEDDSEYEDGIDDGGNNDDMDLDDYLPDDDIPDYKLKVNNSSPDDKREDIPFSVGMTFHEFLIEQLGLQTITEHERSLAEYVIGNIDEEGYLRRPLESMVDDIVFHAGVQTTDEEMARVIKLVQEFDPAGVCATDLRECLILQLARKTGTDKVKNAKIILEKYFDEFTKKHFEKIAKSLNITEADLKDALIEISRLNPKPGNGWGGNVLEKSMSTIVPDFLVESDAGVLTVQLNNSNIPELRVSNTYNELFKTYSERKPGKNNGLRDAVTFAKQKIDSARWFIDAIRQRHQTLLTTMRAIVDFQRDFFTEGDETYMKPMILKDIADITGFDISTISRVSNSKFVQTEFGVFPLKYFFSESMTNDSGEEVSTREIKKILADCIDQEDKKKPLNDDSLVDVLKTKGYLIARRTVAKYREQLNIPVARLRKEL
jgi:RNA polymerase sigma-54 factor